jgi:apolipoprotein N-acyltransferase
MGRVLGVADYFAPGDRTLTVQVPMGGVPTIYAKTGDLFVWLCVASLVAVMGLVTLAPKRLADSGARTASVEVVSTPVR